MKDYGTLTGTGYIIKQDGTKIPITLESQISEKTAKELNLVKEEETQNGDIASNIRSRQDH